MEDITFGNSLSKRKLTVGPRSPVRFLCNMGHMDLQESLDAEKRKVELAHEYGIDIIADNSITEKSRELREWIKHNFPMMMNTVPVYSCFSSMKNGNFHVNQLLDTIHEHVETGSDMIVVHPCITQRLSDKIEKSDRVIKITSRGGSQIHRYIQSTHEENPYFAHWQDICKLLDGTGVSIAIGLSLRAGSIVDDLDPLYLEEMNIAGDLIVQAQQYNIPVVVEGVGHVQVSHIPTLLDEIKKRCYDAPIKTLGPIVSDRMLSEEHINALIGGAIAAVSGASIIGVLFRSEHIGLPTVEDYEESLKNYAILKYALNLTSSQLKLERTMSRCRASRQWSNILKYAFSPRSARDFFCQRHQGVAGTCTMCGERCALLDGFSADACDGVE